MPTDTTKYSDKLQSLINYLRQGDVDRASDFAFEWIKDQTLTYSEWKIFVERLQTEIQSQAARISRWNQ